MIPSKTCAHTQCFPQPNLRILRIQSEEQFQQYEAGLRDLLSIYQSVLLDDFCEPDPEKQMANCRTYLPWLWLLVEDFEPAQHHADGSAVACANAGDKKCFSQKCPYTNEQNNKNRVYGMACLSDITPGRHAFVHGVSHPGIRRHPAVSALGKLVLNVAFNELNVRKVKAEIEANNQGAIGYCRRMGFVREAHFKQDNRIAGQWQDVLVYSLFAEQFQARDSATPCV